MRTNTPERLLIGKKASCRKGKLTGQSGELFDQAKDLISSIDKSTLQFDITSVISLLSDLHEFQNEYKSHS